MVVDGRDDQGDVARGGREEGEALLEEAGVCEHRTGGQIRDVEAGARLGVDKADAHGVAAPRGDAAVGVLPGTGHAARGQLHAGDVRPIVVEGVEGPDEAVRVGIIAGEVHDPRHGHGVSLTRLPGLGVGEHDDGVLLREGHEAGHHAAAAVGDRERSRDAVREPHGLVEDQPDGGVQRDLVVLRTLGDERRGHDVGGVERRGQREHEGAPDEVGRARANDAAGRAQDGPRDHHQVIAGVAGERLGG